MVSLKVKGQMIYALLSHYDLLQVKVELKLINSKRAANRNVIGEDTKECRIIITSFHLHWRATIDSWLIPLHF